MKWNIIEGKPGDPWIMKDNTGQESKVVPRLFVREHSCQKQFPYKYDDFYNIIKQPHEEHEKFKQHLAPLFKAKRAICESLAVDGTRVVINKNDKNILYVEGIQLKFIYELLSNDTMQWSLDIVKEVPNRYATLTASH